MLNRPDTTQTSTTIYITEVSSNSLNVLIPSAAKHLLQKFSFHIMHIHWHSLYYLFKAFQIRLVLQELTSISKDMVNPFQAPCPSHMVAIFYGWQTFQSSDLKYKMDLYEIHKLNIQQNVGQISSHSSNMYPLGHLEYCRRICTC